MPVLDGWGFVEACRQRGICVGVPVGSHVRRAWAPCPDRAAPSARSPGRAGKRSPNVKMPWVSGRVPRLTAAASIQPHVRRCSPVLPPLLHPKRPFGRTGVSELNSISVHRPPVVWKVMRKGGFEPPRPFGHTVLSRARLPFRHFRVGAAPASVPRAILAGRIHALEAPP